MIQEIRVVTFTAQTGTVFFPINPEPRFLGYEARVAFSHAIGLIEPWFRFGPEEAA